MSGIGCAPPPTPCSPTLLPTPQVDRADGHMFTHWDPDAKVFSLQFYFARPRGALLAQGVTWGTRHRRAFVPQKCNGYSAGVHGDLYAGTLGPGPELGTPRRLGWLGGAGGRGACTAAVLHQQLRA